MQQRSKNEFCYGIGVASRKIGDRNPFCRCLLHGNEVQPHPMPDHGFQARRVFRDIVRQFCAHDNAINVTRHLAQGIWLGVGRKNQLGNVLEDRFPVGMDGIGKQHPIIGHG